MAYYKTNRNFEEGQLPLVSKSLDSFRTYQWEVDFVGLESLLQDAAVSVNGNTVDKLTLAAKKISGLEVSVENITADRVNDRLNYPGKVSYGEAIITFDNLYQEDICGLLYTWFRSIYNPITGSTTAAAAPGGLKDTFKLPVVKIRLLGNQMNSQKVINLFGVYPTKYSVSELNYSTSDFHTIEMSLKYDFMEVVGDVYPNTEGF